MARILYDLVGEHDAQRFSPFCWRVRLAAAHKGLELTTIPWRPTDKAAIAFSGQGLVPVLVDGDTVVSDSWTILNYLEDTYPDRPALFPNPQQRQDALFLKAWVETTVFPVIFPLAILDIHDCFHPDDRHYFRSSREARFGATLEAVSDPSPARLEQARKTLEPIRQVVSAYRFLGGDAPNVLDYLAFSPLLTFRCVSSLALVETEGPLADWYTRMLDHFDGLARALPTRDQILASTQPPS